MARLIPTDRMSASRPICSSSTIAAGSKRITAIEVGIDCQTRLPRKQSRNELLCVSLHGDYRYDPLKNTAAELQEQEHLLRAALVESITDTPLIVAGYSGRDASLLGGQGKTD